MINDTLAKIEARLDSAALDDEKKRELRRLLATLKSEVAGLSDRHPDEALSVVGFAERTAHEATRVKQNPDLLKLSIEGLKSSIAQFETSHPKLAETIGTLSDTLANLGI